ncbi:hypothetical protein SLS57_003979 [Botryosphaeria dothidea]
MAIATATRADPNTLPTTVGIVEKKPPFAAPLITTNTASGATAVDSGQRASMLKAVNMNEMKRVFSGPTTSLMSPHAMRPNALAKLKPATSPAPVPADMPSELLYSGKKNGGTNRGNVPMAPARKMVMKR